MTKMRVFPMRSSSVSRSFLAQGPVSLLPRTAVTGAMRESASSTAGSPMSPACTICRLPCSAARASGRSSPCVSEINPTTLALRELEAMRDHAGRADEQSERSDRLDGGDLLIPLLVVGPADVGLEHGQAVDLGTER